MINQQILPLGRLVALSHIKVFFWYFTFCLLFVLRTKFDFYISYFIYYKNKPHKIYQTEIKIFYEFIKNKKKTQQVIEKKHTTIGNTWRHDTFDEKLRFLKVFLLRLVINS